MPGVSNIIPGPYRGPTFIAEGEIPVGQGSSPMVSAQLTKPANVGLYAATTTNSNDSIKVAGASTTLSASSPAFFPIPKHNQAGKTIVLKLTSDVTIKLTGAHWGAGGKGDLATAFLRVYAINDGSGTLKIGIGYVGGRKTIADTDTSTTPTSVTSPEKLLVNSALSAGTWPCIEIGYFYVTFDDTGGAAEDLWAVQTAVGKIVVGESADGRWQDFNPTVGGFSSDQTFTYARWTQFGKSVAVEFDKNANGTSNGTAFNLQLPVKAQDTWTGDLFRIADNGSASFNYGVCRTNAGSTQLDLYKQSNLATWTAANAKGASGKITYQAY